MPGIVAEPPRAKPHGSVSKLERIPPKVRSTILDRIRIGVPLVRAAESCGVPRRTFLRWLEFGRADDARDPYRRFAAQVDRALAEFAVAGIQEVSEHGRKDWRAKAYLLDHGVPEFVEQEQAKRGRGDVNVSVTIEAERKDLAERMLQAAQRVLADDPERLEALVAEVMGAQVVEGQAVEVSDVPALAP